MASGVPRSFLVFACLLGLAGPCGWLATGAKGHGPVTVVGRSAVGETLRGGASLRAAGTSADQQFAVGGVGMRAAKGIAQAYWGADACGGDVAIQWTDQPQTINAVSSWKNPTSAYDDPGQNFDCQMDFNRGLAF